MEVDTTARTGGHPSRLGKIRAGGDALANTGRAIFVIALVFAPWAYGCTRAFHVTILGYILFTAGAFLAIGGLVGWRVRVPIIPSILCLMLAIYGWAAILSPGYLGSLVLTTPEWASPILDGIANLRTRNNDMAFIIMTNLSAMLVGFMIAIDVWSHRVWRLRCAKIVAISAVTFALYGILQRTTGFLQLSSSDGDHLLSFATYRYWGNAGSFLNLVWPLIGALALRAMRLHGANSPKFLAWAIAACLTFSACFINVSKAGNALAAGGLLLAAILLGTFALRRFHTIRISWKTVLILIIPVFAILGSLVALVPWDRWENLSTRLEDGKEYRLLAYPQWIKALDDSGMYGFGPGTFDSINRVYVKDIPGLRNLAWWVAHQDYLQTLIEWGYIGGAIWATLIGISLLVIVVRLIIYWIQSGGRSPVSGSKARAIWMAAALVAVVLTLIHASVDFPLQIPSLQLYFAWWLGIAWAKLK